MHTRSQASARRTGRRPAITPLAAQFDLPQLKDLMVELPPYTEEVVELDMDNEHGRKYCGMESILHT